MSSRSFSIWKALQRYLPGSFLAVVHLISTLLNDMLDCLSCGLYFPCKCVFSAGLSIQGCYKPLDLFKTAVYIVFWHALIRSFLLSVSELFLGKNNNWGSKGSQKEPANNIKAEYVFFSLVILAISSAICWFFLKIHSLRIQDCFSCLWQKILGLICIFPDYHWGWTFSFHMFIAFRWITHTYLVRYWSLDFFYIPAAWISYKDSPCLGLVFWSCSWFISLHGWSSIFFIIILLCLRKSSSPWYPMDNYLYISQTCEINFTHWGV